LNASKLENFLPATGTGGAVGQLFRRDEFHESPKSGHGMRPLKMVPANTSSPTCRWRTAATGSTGSLHRKITVPVVGQIQVAAEVMRR